MSEHWKDKKTGEVNWNERPKEHMRITPGRTSTLRIIDNPEAFPIHWVKQNDTLSMEKCDEHRCEFCEMGIKQTPRYRTNVIDRHDGKVKQIELGVSIFKQIVNIVKQQGNPWDYDIHIERIRKQVGGGSKYVVTASQPTPISLDDQAAINTYKQDELPVGRMVLDIDICPHCSVMGKLIGNTCACPNCGHLIWHG